MMTLSLFKSLAVGSEFDHGTLFEGMAPNMKLRWTVLRVSAKGVEVVGKLRGVMIAHCFLIEMSNGLKWMDVSGAVGSLNKILDKENP